MTHDVENACVANAGEDRLGRAILASLQEADADGFFSEWPSADDDSTIVTIDGHFDLARVAAGVIRRLKDAE